MPRKTFGKALKIKTLNRYVGTNAVYALSRPIKKDKESHKFLFVVDAKAVSGGTEIIVWLSDEHGVVADFLPIKRYKNISIEEALLDLGYKIG